MTFGFIITRHVNSEITNKYWNRCIQCIRTFYPPHLFKIVVIDDNSNKSLIKSDYDYKNVEYVQSEFPGRGELLPYYYFYKNRYFDNAVCIHDSVFIHKKILFDKLKLPVIPLWHFEGDAKYEDNENSLKLINVLKNANNIRNELIDNKSNLLGLNKNDWVGCFGVQSFVNHAFLVKLQMKYNLFNLLGVIRNRRDRMCLERIMAVIFSLESPQIKQIKSIFGRIDVCIKWGYTFQEYLDYIQKYKRSRYPIVKVWTGR
jgi:hypothetical protein